MPPKYTVIEICRDYDNLRQHLIQVNRLTQFYLIPANAMQAPDHHPEGHSAGRGLCHAGVRLHGRGQRGAGAAARPPPHRQGVQDQGARQGREPGRRQRGRRR